MRRPSSTGNHFVVQTPGIHIWVQLERRRSWTAQSGSSSISAGDKWATPGEVKGKRGGAATPVAGQEPKSTAVRLATGVIRPASGMRVIIHTGRKKKKSWRRARVARSSRRACWRQSTLKKPPPPPPPPPGALAWWGDGAASHVTLALCEKENGRVLCASRWETVVFAAHERAASWCPARLALCACARTGVGVCRRGGATSLKVFLFRRFTTCPI